MRIFTDTRAFTKAVKEIYTNKLVVVMSAVDWWKTQWHEALPAF
jgi:hypothetical protein